MILPQSYTAALLLMILGLLCYGLWAGTFMLARGRWRFELHCFDFAFGLMAMALLCGFTFGSSGFDGFSLLDDFICAGKRQWVIGQSEPHPPLNDCSNCRNLGYLSPKCHHVFEEPRA